MAARCLRKDIFSPNSPISQARFLFALHVVRVYSSVVRGYFFCCEGSYFCCEGINIQEISVLLQLIFKQKIENSQYEKICLLDAPAVCGNECYVCADCGADAELTL